MRDLVSERQKERGVKGDPRHQYLGLHTERRYMFTCPHTHDPPPTHTRKNGGREKKKEWVQSGWRRLGKNLTGKTQEPTKGMQGSGPPWAFHKQKSLQF